MEEQLGFDLGRDKPVDGPLFDPAMIRSEARAIIDRARNVGLPAADAESWDADELRYQRILFPHLVSWLPDPAERDQLRFEFGREADRIADLLAA